MRLGAVHDGGQGHHADHASDTPARRQGSSPQHGSHAHHGDDFRRRFWVSLALTIPVLATSEMVQHFLGLRGVLAFRGDRYAEFAFSSAVYLYGGWPFLAGLIGELRKKLPGMMTLVALAISVAYVYSATVVLGLPGNVSLLGDRNADRHHAARPLDRDAVGTGGVAGAGTVGAIAPGGSTPCGRRWLDPGGAGHGARAGRP